MKLKFSFLRAEDRNYEPLHYPDQVALNDLATVRLRLAQPVDDADGERPAGGA